ncbi:RHS repeat domain-containing protein, partial [Leptospira sp. SA-E8]|uniref:RHS repeat domain-containing protein n=1 Tax=Leptospira sp. SA-E8 TaxID=3422259 RepID=UPI003EB8B1C7
TGGGSGGGTSGGGDGKEFVYFYHPDHLGSTSYVTDEQGQRYEYLGYFPFGETWVQQGAKSGKLPYQYTAKELDQEMGLYYYGARYYDARTSVWASVDPILANYLDGKPNGGVFNSLSLGLYSYASNSPIVYFDPDGRFSENVKQTIRANLDKHEGRIPHMYLDTK